jgi:hypothetical protein
MITQNQKEDLMLRYLYSFIIGTFLIIGIYFEANAQQRPPDLTKDHNKALFVYDDVQNFIRAYDLFTDEADSLTILQTEYFDKGTPGLKEFVGKYQLNADKLVKAIRKHPEKYSALHNMPKLLSAFSNLTRNEFAKLKNYIPDIVFPPTYFLIGAYRGIGSGSAEGQLITVENWSIPLEDKTTMIVHELVHFQQAMAMGPEKYIAIYGPEKNLLGLCIREGTAEFFADLVTGKITQDKAVDFTLKNEKKLWKRLIKEMHGRETGDWMWSKPSDPEQPNHVGYVIGYRIVEAYYKNAKDKEQALREILSVTDYSTFLEKSGYTDQFVE